MISLRKGHFCGVPADKGVLLDAAVSAGLQMNFFLFFFLCNLLDKAGSKTVLSGPSAGSKVQVLSMLSVPLTLVVNQTSHRGHRSKCLGFRVTPQAEHGQDLI